MEANDSPVTQKWLDGISYEVAFWNNVYRWRHTFKGLMEWSNLGRVINLDGFDANAFLLRQDHPKVYDVGAGMSYAIGSLLKNADNELVPLDVHYVDPLAFHFNHILRKRHKSLPPIEFGMAEFLSAFIPDHDASLITIQNALDHSANPMKGIAEALVSLRGGGVLYLNHHPNEAEMEKYTGFHQYNIDTDDGGELIIWNRQTRHNVSQLLDGYASVKTSRMADGHIVAVITKNATSSPLPDGLQSYVGSHGQKELCEALLQYQFTHSSMSRRVKDSFYDCLYNTVQFFVQMLPWSVKMKLKRMIKQA